MKKTTKETVLETLTRLRTSELSNLVISKQLQIDELLRDKFPYEKDH